MNIKIRPYEIRDTAKAIFIWNQIVEEGRAFPQMEPLTEASGQQFFFRTVFYRYCL